MTLLLLAACAHPEGTVPPEQACWAPVLADELGESPAGLTVTYTHSDSSCEVGEGDLSGYRLRHYDAAERVDGVVFDGHAGNAYTEWTTWVADTCASYAVFEWDTPSSDGTRTTTTTCVDGWPSVAVTEQVSVGDSGTIEGTGYTAWTYTWSDGLPVRIETAYGAAPDALLVGHVETRDYLSGGRLTHVRDETDEGAWGETLYTWSDEQLVGEAYTSAYGTRAETWTYDAEGRVASWWSSTGPEVATYVYVEGTHRIAGEYVDRAVDGVIDGEPDYFVGYTWSSEGAE